jgi:hypothetical protein
MNRNSAYYRAKHNFLAGKEEAPCSYCQKTLKRDFMTVDHKIPISRGGALADPENFCISCMDCNSLKGCLTPEEFWERKEELEKLRDQGILSLQNPFILCTGEKIKESHLIEAKTEQVNCLLGSVIIYKEKVVLMHGYNHSIEQMEQTRMMAYLLLKKAKRLSKSRSLRFLLDFNQQKVFFRRKQNLVEVFLDESEDLYQIDTDSYIP